jgi:hypothetical protein
LVNIYLPLILFNQALDFYREWGAIGKVQNLSAKRSSSIESTAMETAASSSMQCWASAHLCQSRKSVDLDLLSGTTPRTELPVPPIEPNEQALGARDRDEISILTDTSPERTNNTVAITIGDNTEG